MGVIGFDTMKQGLDTLAQRIDLAAREGLVDAVPTVEAHLKATTAYNNQTGATRASSIVFVEGAEGADVTDAIAQVVALNPGFEAAESMDTDPDAITVIATAYTEYTLDLHTDYGGQHAFLDDVLVGDAGYLADEAFAAIREAFSGS